MAKRQVNAGDDQCREALVGSLLRRKILRAPQVGAWPKDSEIDPKRNLIGTIATLNNRLQALLLELGLRPDLNGWRRLALMLLADYPDFRAFRRPATRPNSQSRPANLVQIAIDAASGASDNRPFPPQRLTEQSAREIRLFRQLVDSGLTKDEADDVIVHDANFQAEVCAAIDPERLSAKPRERGAVKRKALRYESYRLPSGIASPALIEGRLDDAWLQVLEHSAPANDAYLTRIQRMVRSFEAGAISESDCQAEIERVIALEMDRARVGLPADKPGPIGSRLARSG